MNVHCQVGWSEVMSAVSVRLMVLSRECGRCFCSCAVLSSVAIPDCVCELCAGCFKACRRLCLARLVPSSSCERIRVPCFEDAGVEEASIPDGVRQACDCCFGWYGSLHCLTFGSSLYLKRILAQCFGHFNLQMSFRARQQGQCHLG